MRTFRRWLVGRQFVEKYGVTRCRVVARAALTFPRSRVGIDVDVGSSVSLVTEE